MTTERQKIDFAETIARNDINGDDNSLIGIVPSRKSGIQFIRENNAWGFIRMNREPEYLAIYISEDIQKVMIIGKVAKVVDASEANLARPLEEYIGYNSSKKVTVFEPNNIYKLEDPIPYGDRTIYPPIRYTSLGKLKAGESTDDLF